MGKNLSASQDANSRIATTLALARLTECHASQCGLLFKAWAEAYAEYEKRSFEAGKADDEFGTNSPEERAAFDACQEAIDAYAEAGRALFAAVAVNPEDIALKAYAVAMDDACDLDAEKGGLWSDGVTRAPIGEGLRSIRADAIRLLQGGAS